MEEIVPILSFSLVPRHTQLRSHRSVDTDAAASTRIRDSTIEMPSNGTLLCCTREHVRAQANSIKRSESRRDTTKLLYPKGGGVSSPDRTGSRVPPGYNMAAIPERGRRILAGPDHTKLI